MIRFDHLVIAGPDLDVLVRMVEQTTGIRSTPGGPHPGLGTRNELVGVDETTYIELIGPDLEQSDHSGPRPFGVNELTSPRLLTWAVAVDGFETVNRAMADAGLEAGPATPMSRTRPDGVELSWVLSIPPALDLAGIMPFSIDWGQTEHPAAGLDAKLGVRDLTLSHPDPEPIARAIEALTGESMAVATGSARMGVTLSGPDGDITF